MTIKRFISIRKRWLFANTMVTGWRQPPACLHWVAFTGVAATRKRPLSFLNAPYP
jgi:hypothetical protein